MSIIYIVIVILLTLLYQVVKQLLIQGTIYKAYIITDNKNRKCLLLIVDYETIMMGRGPMLSFHTLKLMKIDLQDILLTYDIKIKRYASQMANDKWSLDIFGINETYIFIKTRYDDLLIIDYLRGKLQGNRKRIEKANPRLKGFVLESCKYINSFNSIVIHDRKGYSYLLDIQNIVAEPVNSKTGYSHDKTPKLLTLDNIASVQITMYEPDINKPNPSIVCSKGYYVQIVPGKGNDKYYISCLDWKNEELWRQEIDKIAIRPALTNGSKLYFIELGDRLCFLYLKEPKMSISVADKNSGDIFKGPKQFVCRQIYSFFR